MKLFSTSAKELLVEDEYAEFCKLIESAKALISQYFILCFAESPNLQKHKDIHGESVLEFSSAIGMRLIANGIHNWYVGKINSPSYTQNLFRNFEGFVLYDETEQRKIAKEICEIYKEGVTSIVDNGHFLDAFLIFIMLTKRHRFSWEKEYRIGFLSMGELDDGVLKQTETGKHHIQIKLPEGVEKFKEYDS